MPPKGPPPQPAQQASKRKEPPKNASSSSSKSHPAKRPRFDQGSKIRDARHIATQTSSKAFKHGELDVDKFVKSREYEIRALEQGLARSKKALTKRAFQQVPKELRRRTASHNVKRIPKKLRERGKREMAEDNTPTVTARRRKATRHMRLRLETAKKLRAMGAKRKSIKEKEKDEKVTVTADGTKKDDSDVIKTRAPKVKKATLAQPPVPKAKFRKRQMHKSWLPTHMFHTKRARMTPPKEPLWRFAIPMTPTAKSYRPTHRAASERGALCWDVSYMSTISLAGREASIAGLLRQLGAGESTPSVWGIKGQKWRDGKRAMEFLLHEREEPHAPIALVTVIWRAPNMAETEEKRNRQVLLRVHPSAFLQLWEEVLRVAKIVKPSVMVEDLRFDIGSIDVTGPASTEALLSALWPTCASPEEPEHQQGSSERTFTQLHGLTNPALLPSGAILAFDIQDPRLHHPPRPVKQPSGPDSQMKLLELLAAWPSDSHNNSARIFDRKARISATANLPSQKAINRRRTLATPGEYPAAVPKDPRIPVLIYVLPPKPHAKNQQLTYHVLLPWKCVQPVWYSLMYTPLSTGQQPKFGGLDEQRQIALERGEHWFPADYPGTKAGWDWEVEESKKRKSHWEKRPKGKRTNWETVDLGNGKKGEIGNGWACDWRVLLEGASKTDPSNTTTENPPTTTTPKPKPLTQLPPSTTTSLPLPTQTLLPIRLTPLTRGLPTPCARIYRLPTTSPKLHAAWLALHPSNHATTKAQRKASAPPPRSDNLPAHIRQQRLAASLLEPPRVGGEGYPVCPGEEDLVGFVTSGNYDLGGGRGGAVGCLLAGKVDLGAKGEEARLCVVREAGESVGRLARWEV